jgi:hypothetical protein
LWLVHFFLFGHGILDDSPAAYLPPFSAALIPERPSVTILTPGNKKMAFPRRLSPATFFDTRPKQLKILTFLHMQRLAWQLLY